MYDLAHLDFPKVCRMRDSFKLTVNGNGHDLGQVEAICAHKGRNTIQRIELEILGGRIRRSRLDEFEVELVGFGDNLEHCCASVALGRCTCQL